MFDADTGKVVVSDGVIMYYNDGKPTDGVLVSSTSAKTVFTWSVFARSSSGQHVKMNYRAVLLTANSAFSVLARPIGFGNTFSSEGTCQPG